MESSGRVTRRSFIGGLAVGGVATAMGYAAVGKTPLWSHGASGELSPGVLPPLPPAADEYDSMAKLSFNENPYGPPKSVLDAMTHAFKYANRYGYPDGGLEAELASHHGVKRENILTGAGSGEILEVVGATWLQGGKKVVGVEPSYNAVYTHATSIRAETVLLPLRGDYSQDIPAMIKATVQHYRDVGFVYLCNPNNPTGRIVSDREVRALLDGIPEDIPVLIDEAYHHFVEDRSYSTAIPYVLEGRPVIVARTFSKIAALAGMRLGYAVARADIISKMRPQSTGSVNALVKWGGVAALRDTDAMAAVRNITISLRKRTVGELQGLGYSVIPSEGNFFMVHLRTPVQPVIEEFRKRGVLVGRPFPPMTEHLRVSVGTEDEMNRFMTAFREIFPKVA